jgi:hypothetical protein
MHYLLKLCRDYTTLSLEEHAKRLFLGG